MTGWVKNMERLEKMAVFNPSHVTLPILTRYPMPGSSNKNILAGNS